MPGISAWHPLSGLLRAGSNGFSQSVASGQGGGVFYRSNVHIIFKVLRIDHKGIPIGHTAFKVLRTGYLRYALRRRTRAGFSPASPDNPVIILI